MKRLSLLASLSLLAMLVFSSVAFAQSESNDPDCADFDTQRQAQQFFNTDTSDPAGLDGPPGEASTGLPGLACENLPGNPNAGDEPTPSGEIGDLDCISFQGNAEQAQSRAQAVYEQNPDDPNRLDADNDGTACEYTSSVQSGVEFEDGSGYISGAAAPQPPDNSGAVQYENQTNDGSEDVTELPDTGGPALLPIAGIAAVMMGIGSLLLKRRLS